MKYRPFLKGKKIYLPFDNENSNFVKYLKNNKKHFKCEFKYTSNDFRENIELFKWCDVVLTNPPFSILTSDILPFFEKLGVKYIMISPTLIGNKWMNKLIGHGENLNIRFFETPSRVFKNVKNIVISNYLNLKYGIYLKNGCCHKNKYERFKKGEIYIDCWDKHDVYVSISNYIWETYYHGFVIDPKDIKDWDGDSTFRQFLITKPWWLKRSDEDGIF